MKCAIVNTMKPDVPANDLPLLPPDAEIETKPVLRRAISANRELARLKGYCSLLPNETILLNTIVLKEARASSEIENIVTTQDELYRALAADDRQMTPETKEVLNYRSAVWTGYRLLQGTGLLTSRTIVAIQEELEGDSTETDDLIVFGRNGGVPRRTWGRITACNDKTAPPLHKQRRRP